MTQPRRPALGAVINALTVLGNGDPPPSYWCDATGLSVVVSDRGQVVVVGSPHHSVRYGWVTHDPAEAWEMLQTRDLIPMDYVGRFVCEACGGRGSTDVVAPGGFGFSHRCYACKGAAHLPHPPTVAALASWASLGFAASDDGSPGILGAEELAGHDDFAGAVFSAAPPVWWRVSAPGGDEPRAYRSGSPKQALLDAGLGFRRRPTHTALYAPPLGVP